MLIFLIIFSLSRTYMRKEFQDHKIHAGFTFGWLPIPNFECKLNSTSWKIFFFQQWDLSRGGGRRCVCSHLCYSLFCAFLSTKQRKKWLITNCAGEEKNVILNLKWSFFCSVWRGFSHLNISSPNTIYVGLTMLSIFFLVDYSRI